MASEHLAPSTTAASAASAQSRGEEALAAPSPNLLPRDPDCSVSPDGYTIGPRVYSAIHAKAYERRLPADPLYRPLRIYSLDPTASRLEGGVALVNVPYEPLDPGPVGQLFEVVDLDSTQQVTYEPVDLDDKGLLIRSGRTPSTSDPMFHQQMAYAVCSLVYAAFKSALGRHVGWGFRDAEHRSRLRVHPHAFLERNAYYDKERGSLSFGYYFADNQVNGPNLPGGLVCTCLSHDVVAHEVTHALLDGLRAHFAFPSGPDVLAFHEAFADLVAVFQHFSYEEVLVKEVGKARGELGHASLLVDLARQFGQTTGRAGALRTVSDIGSETPVTYQDACTEPHRRGSVLTAAVFDAFVTVYKRRTARFIRLATGGTGVLPDGELPHDLTAALAHEASKVAEQFLTMCIRAIDYCPPVDLTFGEYLRAVITADADLVPDDPWGYREAWIHAFQKRRIYPKHVRSLSEEELIWQPAPDTMPVLEELSFARLAFNGDPGCPAGREELSRQACALGSFLSNPAWLEEFGLTRPGDPRLDGDQLTPPCIESIRSSRRIGPDRQVVFDLIAEVTQRRTVQDTSGQGSFETYGGVTIILDPKGNLRYLIRKSVLDQQRIKDQGQFLATDCGRRYWIRKHSRRLPNPQLFQLMHHIGAT